ncbi:MAG: alpha/beta hydrolase [Gammaproteobacteria bacterium]|jgi:2-hydroxy-6-oxonona-2,4-dienedioate hydrolase|nr:alpha/beta hydrolase [Gammaproteobacteria bacterium]
MSNEKSIVYLSGMFAGGWIWERVVPLIAADTIRVIEQPLCEISNRLDDLSDHVVDQVMGIPGPVTLVSNSLGSYLALKTANLLPEKVERVVVSGAAGFADVDLGVRITPRKAREAAKSLVEMIFFDKSKIEWDYAARVEDCFVENLRPILRLMLESNRASAAELFPGIRCPVHAIWGRGDVITTLAAARDTFNRYGVRVDVLEECGHSPMCEAPERFAHAFNTESHRLQLRYETA